MRNAIGTLVLLAASVAAVMTPAVAATRDQRGFGSAFQNDNQAKYGSVFHQNDVRMRPEIRRDNDQDRYGSAFREDDIRTAPGIRRGDSDSDRLREAGLRNERYLRDREDWRYRFDRDRRW